MDGILLIDKPCGITSHDVVDRIRRVAGTRRVGHTGTLDPAATGLLILCLGQATRLSDFLIGMDKVYEGTMRLGVVTDSYDLDGSVVERRAVPEGLTRDRIQAECNRFVGTIQQTPPMVSAVKVGGERLYKLARKGETVERAARSVTVREFSVLEYASPDAVFRVRCTRGTYARSLCHDVGMALGCGAALAALRRTAVGPHGIAAALPLDRFVGPEDVVDRLLPPEMALTLPEVRVFAHCERLVGCGGALHPADIEGFFPMESGWVQVKTRSGRLLAVAEVTAGPQGFCLQPRRVLVG
ncbi:MAG TPA: tRNA pseudouridine(55) synthase TruB [Candidatus Hydrogenedentes bacterium]|nr:tRNA pseudouridine(55) synthase TruB [Candidatus Hydrogenedentota bacterium]